MTGDLQVVPLQFIAAYYQAGGRNLLKQPAPSKDYGVSMPLRIFPKSHSFTSSLS